MATLIRSPFTADWKDAWGNSFEHLVDLAVCGIVNSGPGPFRYEPEHYPGLVIKQAIDQVESALGRKLKQSPIPSPGISQSIESSNSFCLNPQQSGLSTEAPVPTRPVSKTGYSGVPEKRKRQGLQQAMFEGAM
jgi:hypothetical protein